MVFKLGKRVSKYLILILFFMSSFMVSASEETKIEVVSPHIKGALCYIKADDKVVFVDEVFTKKLSLPGGTITANETSRKAAERETWEETGLVVTAKEILTQTETAVVYHCTPDSGVIAFTASDEQGFHALPAWFAPDFRIEVNRVLLAYTDSINPQQYRYPEQYAQQVLNHDIPNAPIQYIDSAISAAPPVHQFELPIIQAIQSSIVQLPEAISNALIGTLKIVNLSSSIFGVLFLLPLLVYYFGGKSILHLTFIGIVTVSITLLIQLGLKYPRPFIYQPSLQLTDPLGFSTPSIHAALSVVLIGYLFHVWRKIYDYESIWGCLFGVIALTLTQGISSIILGEQFASDVLFGYLIGLFTLWHYIRLEGKPSITVQLVMLHPALWWVSFIGLSFLAYQLHSIQLANIAAVAFALLLALSSLLKTQRLDSPYLTIKLIICWLTGGVILFTQPFWFPLLVQSSMSGYFTQCGLWFVLTYMIIKISCIPK
ncbi:phosphatase PAP2 family protein [Vibrio algivorus]|uniref:Phosphatase PAP2 family protein n=1 Tax=Vibrio algivorus TaxID=1667024 RepID=A0A557NYS9_9VIBR|nr:phosphatase PAP2 family protein [Vibrio algivorus]